MEIADRISLFFICVFNKLSKTKHSIVIDSYEFGNIQNSKIELSLVMFKSFKGIITSRILIDFIM